MEQAIERTLKPREGKGKMAAKEDTPNKLFEQPHSYRKRVLHRPMTFYIGPCKGDMNKLRENIRKNGGRISKQAGEGMSQIINLGDAQSRPRAADRPVYSVNFIRSCIDAGCLLDRENFLLKCRPTGSPKRVMKTRAAAKSFTNHVGKTGANGSPVGVGKSPLRTPYNMRRLVSRNQKEDEKAVREEGELHATPEDDGHNVGANLPGDGNESITMSGSLVDGVDGRKKASGKGGHEETAEGGTEPLPDGERNVQEADAKDNRDEENAARILHEETPAAGSDADLEEVQPDKAVPVKGVREKGVRGQKSRHGGTDARKKRHDGSHASSASGSSDHYSDHEIEPMPSGNDKNAKHQPREKIKAVRADDDGDEIDPVKRSRQKPPRVHKDMRVDTDARKHGVENSDSGDMTSGSDEAERGKQVDKINKRGRKRRVHTHKQKKVLDVDGEEMGIVRKGSDKMGRLRVGRPNRVGEKKRKSTLKVREKPRAHPAGKKRVRMKDELNDAQAPTKRPRQGAAGSGCGSEAVRSEERRQGVIKIVKDLAKRCQVSERTAFRTLREKRGDWRQTFRCLR